MTKGIHHITAIASNAQANLDFYTKVLGLRLVKKTVNQDDPATYHLFFGDKRGEAGMDLTFFIFLPPMQGQNGNGLVTKISLAVPQSSLPFWVKRLKAHNVQTGEMVNIFGHDRIIFYDSDHQQLELVGVDDDTLGGSGDVWTTKEISTTQAIRHFHSATLSVGDLVSIEDILTEVLGYQKIDQDQHLHLYKTSKKSSRAELIEISVVPSRQQGINAAGTVHHIAFRADDTKHQLVLRQKAVGLGLLPTGIINRFYFQSVYFRTRVGILFEIATDGPGFTSDESESELGTHLSLPPFLESKRSSIEAQLKPLIYDPTL